jgi:hypothetical protein
MLKESSLIMLDLLELELHLDLIIHIFKLSSLKSINRYITLTPAAITSSNELQSDLPVSA